MNIKKIVCLTAFIGIYTTHTAEQPVITITNKTNNPIIIDLYTPKAGSFGLLIQANAQQVLNIPEFYWFEKQAVGGFRKPGTPSKVRIVDVLKHGYANTMDIIIPNEDPYSFSLQPKSLNIMVAPGEAQAKVTIEKALP